MARKTKARKGKGKKAIVKKAVIIKCQENEIEDIECNEDENLKSPPECSQSPLKELEEHNHSDNPSKKLKLDIESTQYENNLSQLNGIPDIEIADTIENTPISPTKNIHSSNITPIPTEEHMSISSSVTESISLTENLLLKVSDQSDIASLINNSNLDINDGQSNDNSFHKMNGDINNEDKLLINSKVNDLKNKDVIYESFHDDTTVDKFSTQLLVPDTPLSSNLDSLMQNGNEIMQTDISINNLGSEVIVQTDNCQIKQELSIEYQPSKVEDLEGPVSSVDLDDNHILKDINSISESRIKTLDIVAYVESIKSDNRKIYEDLLINKLYFARNCFATSPPEWYEYFEQLHHYHQEILKNITDFNIWVSLLQYSESLLRNPKVIQEAKQHVALDVLKNSFDEFLQRYPYCYGYWKNYADIAKKFGNMDDVYKIYERALDNFPNSVDLWVFFINFVIENSNLTNEKFSNKNIELLLEDAVKKVGSDYKSEPLWDLYITWEMRMGNMRKVTEILDMAIREVTSAYKQFFERFKNHVETNDLHDILNEEELEKMKKALNISSQPVPSYNYHPFNHLSDVMIKYKFYEMPDEQIIAIREKLIETRQEIMNEVEGEFKKRKTFEDNIKRPYFHIKPLERFQLKNWSQYLDFELAQVPDAERGESGLQEKRKRVEMIFNRCLITCALYEEFWIKYARYLETIDIPAMRKVFQRACFVHLETHPNPFLTWSALEERYDNLKATSFILNLINRNVPGLVQVNLRIINLARRHGEIDRVEQMYRECLAKYESNLCYYSFYTINYARFVHKVLNDKAQAIKLLEDALNNDPHNEKLYLQLIDIQYQSHPLEVEQIVNTFDKALGGTLPDASKTAFAQRKYEFVESFDTDVVRINKARDDFMSLLKNQLGGEFSNTVQKSYVKGNVPIATNTLSSSQAVASSSAPAAPIQRSQGTPNASGDYYTAAYYQQWAAASAYSYPSPLAYPPPVVSATGVAVTSAKK